MTCFGQTVRACGDHGGLPIAFVIQSASTLHPPGHSRGPPRHGDVNVFGQRQPGPDVAIHLHDRKLYTRLFVNPELYAAEAYMDGTLTLEDGAEIHDFLLLFSVNRAGLYSYSSQKLMRQVWRGLRRWHQANPIGVAATHARHHYASRPNFTVCSSTIKCNIPALTFGSRA